MARHAQRRLRSLIPPLLRCQKTRPPCPSTSRLMDTIYFVVSCCWSPPSCSQFCTLLASWSSRHNALFLQHSVNTYHVTHLVALQRQFSRAVEHLVSCCFVHRFVTAQHTSLPGACLTVFLQADQCDKHPLCLLLPGRVAVKLGRT